MIELSEISAVETHELSTLIEVISGFAFDSNLFNDEGDGMPLVRIRDVGQQSSKTFFSGEYSSDFVLHNGDFIVGMDGDFRLAEWQGGPALLNQRVCKIVPKSELLHPSYLFHFLPLELKKIEDNTPFVTVKHLSVKKIRGIRIPLPSLAEQQRIAAILDAADAHRQKTKALLEKYDQLAQSIFLEMFGDSVTNEKGWEVSKIDDISTKVTDGEHLTPKREPSGYFLVSARNVQNGYIDFTNVDYVGEEEFERISRRCNPEKGDLLISCSGSIGRVTSIRVDAPFVLVRSAALVKPDSAVVNVRYLEFYLRTPYVQALMLKTANASSQANLFTGQIKEIPVLLPPLNEQNLFSERIKVLDEMIESTQSLCLKSESLFQSLLQGAFSGKMA